MSQLPTKVKVYWNLHKDTFSIVTLDKGENYGKVWGYADSLHLVRVNFKVSEAGRQRVLKEKRKNVHAYVVGELNSINVSKGWIRGSHIRYNPYLYQTFVDDEEKPVYKADEAFLFHKQVFASGIQKNLFEE